MAYKQIILLALALSSASSAPQNVVLRAVPFGAVPFAHPVAQTVRAVAPANAAVATPFIANTRAVPVAAPVTRTVVETEAVEIDPSYQFGYSVTDTKTGDSKTREETRDGDVVTGSYTVADPDGRVRRVTYTADAVNGFNAVVTYDGEAGPPAIPVGVPAPVAAGPVIQAVRNVAAAPIAAVRNVASPAVVHANPTVATDHATHRIHTAVAPHLVHGDVAPTTTFLRNADGSLTPVNFNGLNAVPLNAGFLRAFPNLNAATLIHA